MTLTQLSACTLLFLSGMAAAQAPVPQDQGLLRVYQDLRQLKTTARILQVTAHPDDEDGGLLTMEARGSGAEVRLMTLTRGEGGQNKFGGEVGDELGVIRTLELLEADRFYGVEQRFSRAADFGFSKSADETFEKWGGHDGALADLVREIRSFRPDVLVARFSGTPRDGHGHHQASAILTREAFEAAGDPKRFPEQLKDGLQAWRPKRLYTGVAEQGAPTTVRFDTGTYSPLLGMSYAQFALEGLSHQISQGVGGLRLPAGHRYTYYTLVAHEGPDLAPNSNDLLAGLPMSVTDLPLRLGSEGGKYGWLADDLKQIEGAVAEAESALRPDDPSRAAAPLARGRAAVDRLLQRLQAEPAKDAGLADMRARLQEKREQFDRAVEDALGLAVEAVVDSGQAPISASGFPSPQNTFQVAVPGESFSVSARIVNRGSVPVQVRSVQVRGQDVEATATEASVATSLAPGEDLRQKFSVKLPANMPLTRPYWHRSDVQRENTVKLDQPGLAGRPLMPYPLYVTARVQVGDFEAETVPLPVQTKTVDPVRGQLSNPLIVAPALSIQLEPATQVMTTQGDSSRSVVVGATSFAKGASEATVRPVLPAGWRAEPESRTLHFANEGEHQSVSFALRPGALQEQRYQVSAEAKGAGGTYGEGLRMVGRPDIGEYPFYRPAAVQVSAVDVKVPPNLRVGYIPGAGDEILDVLKQLHVNVQEVSAAELQAGDLSRYDTIVLGIRAYDVRADVRANRDRLLQFAERGGTVLMQNNQSAAAATLLPHPATGGNERVSVEDAPVTVLHPEDPVFHAPNAISAKDWDGWVQERGLSFLKSWDEHYVALLSMHDPNEKALEGGLLVATYGKGRFIYTGLAFARQLPAGVPGAIRLYVNLLAAGHTSR